MLSVFLPQRCVSCSDNGIGSKQLTRYLCSRCIRILDALEPPSEVDIKGRLDSVLSLDYRLALSSYPFQHDSVTQSVIHAVKYTGMPRLGRILGQTLASTHRDLSREFDLLIPVPLHRTRQAERGFNQAEVLAAGIADVWPQAQILPHGVARRTRPTKTQTQLSIQERIENVRGAFSIREKHFAKITGKRVALIDDVLTTGATLASLAEAVSVAQPASLSFLTLAAAERSASS
jgi:ComF family protein